MSANPFAPKACWRLAENTPTMNGANGRAEKRRNLIFIKFYKKSGLRKQQNKNKDLCYIL